MNFTEFRENLIGNKIENVVRIGDSDEGFVLIFDDGSILRVGFSSHEGAVFYISNDRSDKILCEGQFDRESLLIDMMKDDEESGLYQS